MKKVKITIEVTPDSYSREVEFEGKTYKEKFLRTPYGAKSAGPSIEYQPDLPDYVAENVDDMYDLMQALKQGK